MYTQYADKLIVKYDGAVYQVMAQSINRFNKGVEREWKTGTFFDFENEAIVCCEHFNKQKIAQEA